ncbi:MAG: SdrD B-like domain-containing protein [Chloroflexota bacterium]
MSGLNGVSAISGSHGHTLALKTGGTVWAWGQNSSGQLGIGTADWNSHSTPVQMSGFAGASAIEAGGEHSLAIAPPSATTPTSTTIPVSGSGGGESGEGTWRPWPTPTPNPNTGEGYANPTAGGSMTSRDRRVTVDMPGGAVDRLVKLWYEKHCATEIDSPSGWRSVGCPFDLRAVDASDERVNLHKFDRPISVTVRYSDTEAEGLNELSFRIGYYDGGQWVPYPSRVDPQANTVTADMSHFSLHTLLGSAAPVGSTISGLLYYDRDGNGEYGEEDSPIANARVKVELGGWQGFTTTGPDGRYTFPSPSEDGDTLSFTPFESVISGLLYYDRDGDGEYGGDDFPIANGGVKIESGECHDSTTTGSDGRYAFNGLGEGSYSLLLEVGSEWAYTTPNKIDGIALTGQADSRRTDLDFGMWYRLR